MFRDRYSADNDKIVPNEELLKCLSVKMKNVAAGVAEDPIPSKKIRPLWIRSAVALVACFAVTITVLALSQQGWKSNTTLIAVDASDTTEVTDTADATTTDATTTTDITSTTSAVSTTRASTTTHATSAPVKVKIETVKNGTSYKELYSIINSLPSNGRHNGGVVAPTTGTDTATAESPSDSYSKTNVQVNGVDEADIVKTDGSYIYTLSNNNVVIVRADSSDMKVVSRIDLSLPDGQNKSTQAIEMFVRDNRLIVLKNQYFITKGTTVQSDVTSNVEGTAVQLDVVGNMAWCSDGLTSAAIYDISDRTNPVLLSDLGQSGNYLSSRMVGNTLYLISNHAIYGTAEENKLESFVPMLYTDGSGTAMSADTICISVKPQSRQYVVVSAIDVQNTKERLSSQSVFGYVTNLYANEKNMLIASGGSEETVKDSDSSGSTHTIIDKTNLIRFSLNDGKIELAASGSVPGSLLNQFSMDEYNGSFRIVTTENTYTLIKSSSGNNGTTSVQTASNSTVNALYTLNQDLREIGSITDVAKGERVYSVRFDGPIGYFVTFRQVDPLFTVDLTNPAKPTILSALKIPGFSNYLHPYANGLLFGLGQNANENTGRTNGLKLSMFDVSDPTNVSEKNKLLLDEYGSEASNNHKAIVVSAERNLIAFPTNGEYLVFSYTPDNGFTQKAKLNLGYGIYRGMFIGNVFYVSSNSTLTAYSMDDYIQLSSLALQ